MRVYKDSKIGVTGDHGYGLIDLIPVEAQVFPCGVDVPCKFFQVVLHEVDLPFVTLLDLIEDRPIR